MRRGVYEYCSAALLVVCLSGCGDRSVCGDGRATQDEPCDGSDLRGATCWSQGHLAGVIACDAVCTLDETGCLDDPCEVFGWYGDGVRCDPCLALGGQQDPDCAALCGQADGQCSPPTYYSLEVLGWTCAVEGFPDQDPDCPVCGNGVAEPPEQCDGTDLPAGQCADLPGWLGSLGLLTCTPDCAYDLSSCTE
jgi:hypothetical protein